MFGRGHGAGLTSKADPLQQSTQGELNTQESKVYKEESQNLDNIFEEAEQLLGKEILTDNSLKPPL